MWQVWLLLPLVGRVTSLAVQNETCASYPDGLECNRSPANCVKCQYNTSCMVGEQTTSLCSPLPDVDCIGNRTWHQPHICAYCFQLPINDYTCIKSTNCTVARSPSNTYTADCTVKSTVYCLGSRKFKKKLKCDWTSGHRWSTAMLLSITLGGFGVDRFYLGYWQSALGKLFSFGGAGVWTIVDVLLIAVGYLTPADGSLYIF
ncbi:TM2 domain-containing protein 3-like [Corticium candelabrum]|uniref:TM2 domain-containing protein 3-like n=1 Tax=Corticium candelabrum TaxID=121492 RepID=UPI002E26FD59|nr:TM2 domain-containing protein 3-like [Corticium candelabrum]